MTQLTRKRVVLAKIETSYGVDPVPTGSANAILIKNLTVTPIAATMVGRDFIRPYLGESDQLIADKHTEVEFEVEMAGAGEAGDVPAYGPLLRACAMAETVTADTKVDYTPVSSGFESVTIYVNVDGVLHKLTGARGTVELDITAKQIPTFKFRFTGVYNTVTDTALPSTVYDAFQYPLVANNMNTTGFSFFGASGLVLESLAIDTGIQVDFRALIGTEYVQIVDRKASGEVSFEATSVATLDVFGKAIGSTNGTLSITHGTAAGNKVQITAANVDIGNPTYADSNGVNMVKCPFYLIPDAGNDEFKITVL